MTSNDASREICGLQSCHCVCLFVGFKELRLKFVRLKGSDWPPSVRISQANVVAKAQKSGAWGLGEVQFGVTAFFGFLLLTLRQRQGSKGIRVGLCWESMLEMLECSRSI